MGLLSILGLILYTVWIYIFVKFRLKLRNSKLKYLFEPRVNFMAKSGSASRYDAINASGWSNIIFGAILLPVRLIIVISVLFTTWVLVRIHCKIVGCKN